MNKCALALSAHTSRLSPVDYEGEEENEHSLSLSVHTFCLSHAENMRVNQEG